jgi:hypothetical protein
MNKLLNWQPSPSLVEADIHQATRRLIKLIQDCLENQWDTTKRIYIDRHNIIRWLSAPGEDCICLGSIKELHNNAPQIDPFWHYVKLIKSKKGLS